MKTNRHTWPNVFQRNVKQLQDRKIIGARLNFREAKRKISQMPQSDQWLFLDMLYKSFMREAFVDRDGDDLAEKLTRLVEASGKVDIFYQNIIGYLQKYQWKPAVKEAKHLLSHLENSLQCTEEIHAWMKEVGLIPEDSFFVKTRPDYLAIVQQLAEKRVA